MALFVLQDGSYLIGEGDILNLRELCEKLGVSHQTVLRWIGMGMPFTEFKNCKGFWLKEVNEWLRRNR